VVIDAVVRLLPGALGNPDSARFESFGAAATVGDEAKLDGVPRSTQAAAGLLDYPHYTRPEQFRGVGVPEALMSGDHEAIRKWRRRMALEKTWRNRPDLLENAELSEEDEEILGRLRTDSEHNSDWTQGFDPQGDGSDDG